MASPRPSWPGTTLALAIAGALATIPTSTHKVLIPSRPVHIAGVTRRAPIEEQAFAFVSTQARGAASEARQTALASVSQRIGSGKGIGMAAPTPSISPRFEHSRGNAATTIVYLLVLLAFGGLFLFMRGRLRRP
jgi:hypothetical protein